MKESLKRVVKKVPPISKMSQQLEQQAKLIEQQSQLVAQLGARVNQLEEVERVWVDPRASLARRYIKGEGIEIGAAHMPVILPEAAHVQYVDMASTEDLIKLWPEIAGMDIVHVDIVDDGEKLSKIKPCSLDFIIANHFLEHCLDPIGTLENFVSKLKQKGVIYMAIPEKHYTFDVDRPVTTFEHLLEEYKAKSSRFVGLHTEEYVRLAEKVEGNVDTRIEELINSGYRIHYHVWDTSAIMQLFLRAISELNMNLELEAMMANNNEVIVVLKKIRRTK